MPVRSHTDRVEAQLSSDAFATLFARLHEGVYIGVVQDSRSVTLAANSQLRVMFGWTDDAPAADVRPFDPERFVDVEARTSFLQQLVRDGSAVGYLLRLRRADDAAMWVEVTARAEPSTGAA